VSIVAEDGLLIKAKLRVFEVKEGYWQKLHIFLAVQDDKQFYSVIVDVINGVIQSNRFFGINLISSKFQRFIYIEL